jgi:uncharacterized protein (TIGR03435 family)
MSSRNGSGPKNAAVCVTLAIIMVSVLYAQSNKGPTFEVVSIRRNTSTAPGPGGRMQLQPGGRFNANSVTVRQLILRAYGIQDLQLLGGPDWINSYRFDISAKAEDQVTAEQLAIKVKTLLAERFRLVVHPETRDTPIYALVLAKKDGAFGPKLRRSNVDCDAIAAEAVARGGAPPPTPAGEWSPCSIGFSGSGQMGARSKPMAQLLTFFSQVAGRTVVDRTGLMGSFDVDLTWTPLSSGTASTIPDNSLADDPSRPSIFVAVEEQLGLKLQAEKSSSQVFVIDSVEQPSEN